MANTAAQAASLAADPAFRARLSVLLDAEGMVVLRESGATSGHAARAELAKNILFSPDSYATVLAKQLVFDTNMINAAITVNEDGSVTSAATDGAIRSQIATNWSDWCGIAHP